jgi:hypothetical protein
VDEIGGLIVDLIRNAAKARAARQAGQPALPPSEALRRFLVGGPQPDLPAGVRVNVGGNVPKPPPPPRPPAPPAPAPPVAAPRAPEAPLLADFRDGRRFLAAFVLAEALGPPVGLRRDER